MPSLRPDPTFYASPKHAIQTPSEELAYVAMLDAPMRSVWSTSGRSLRTTAPSSAARTCPAPAMSSTISAGTPVGPT